VKNPDHVNPGRELLPQTVSLVAARQASVSDNVTPTVILWISRCLETLWLLGVVLVPIVFFRPENFLSEAVIAYLEVPKIALLRTLVGLMVILWLVEWGISGGSPFSWLKNHGGGIRPSTWLTRLSAWLRDQPTQWLILAVWFFLVTTLLSTVLSASFSVSLWGEVPGQDGFSTYNIVAYILFFGVIVSHLRTPTQLWRLLGAIVIVGVMVSGYAILQHDGHDFLGVLEETGGGRARVTSITGNAVFAGAAMLMPIGVSLMLATITLSKLAANFGARQQIRPKLVFLAILDFWVLVLAVQFLGLIFTFSRGPWLGTLLALAAFLALAAPFVGWRTWVWAALVIAMAVGISWWVLQGSGLVFSASPWPDVVIALAGILVLGAIFGGIGSVGGYTRRPPSSMWQPRLSYLSRSFLSVHVPLTIGLVAATGIAAAIAVFLFSGDVMDPGGGPSPRQTSSTLAVQQRFASITSEVSAGALSGRGRHWQDSWQLVRNRPWFEFDNSNLSWLRSIIGYGPDLFRYVYLLESTPQGSNRLPTEPDHAHNFFIHQIVEQGLLGLVGSLALFGALFGAGGYLLLSKRTQYSQVHRLVLVGLLAVMAGRFLEQMVGIARVSDLTIFWVLLAAFVALPGVMRASEPAEQPALQQTPRNARARNQRGSRAPDPNYDWHRFVRLALVAWAAGGIIALTWVKTINYPQAGTVAADAMDQFQRGNFQGAVAGLDRAINLAPDVVVYYSFKSSVLAAYLQNPEVPREPECSLAQGGNAYEICLVEKIYINNLEAVQQRPFYWRSRLALANSALALGRHEEAIRLYREAVSLVPQSWPLLNRLAEVYIDVGQPEQALPVLEESLAITQDTRNSEKALSLQTLAYQEMDVSGKANPPP
jgi:tetratricopeptide (TPR) repeat protein